MDNSVYLFETAHHEPSHEDRLCLQNIASVYRTERVNAKLAGVIYKSIAGRYRPVSYPDGPITARYRFIDNASWELIAFVH